jgi:hypothetical protein
MLIPFPHNPTSICLNQPQQHAQRPSIEAFIIVYPNRGVQPEFRLQVVLRDVNVDRLLRRSLIRIEEEPEAALSKHFWHDASIVLSTIRVSL